MALNHYLAESCHKHLRSNDPNAQKALKYLRDRGLTEETIRRQKIGFYQKKAMFPNNSPDIYINGECYTQEMITGKKYDAVLPNYFENRILFPLRDSKTSDVLGFIGRLVGEDEQERKPKYITKNNKYYKKSEYLYLMNEAIDAIQEKGSVIIVEGVFDALLMHQIGRTNTVALLGMSISDKQISLIKEYIPTNKSYKIDLADILTFFDNEEVGIAASIRIYEKFKKTDLFVLSIITLSSWKDPADWILDPKKIRPSFTYKSKQHEGALPFWPIYPDFDDYIKKWRNALSKRIRPIVDRNPKLRIVLAYCDLYGEELIQKDPDFYKRKEFIGYIKEYCGKAAFTVSEETGQYTDEYTPRNETDHSEPQQGIQSH